MHALLRSSVGSLGSLAVLVAAAAPILEPAEARAAPPSRALAQRLEARALAGLERVRMQRTFGGAPVELEPPPPTALDLVGIAEDLTFDPSTGSTSATIAVTVRGTATLTSSFMILVDQGLAVTSATSSAGTVTTGEQVSLPFNVIDVHMTPPLAANAEATLTISVDGSLVCGSSGPTGSRYCGLDPVLQHALGGAVFPMFVDPRVPFGFDEYALSVTLHTPTGVDALVSADFLGEESDGASVTTTWSAPSLLSSMQLVMVTGKLGKLDVPTTSPPARVHYVAADPAWAEEMGAWTTKILPFIDGMTGMTMPYAALDEVKLPSIPGFPGTATRGMTFLSDSYAKVSPEFFEEDLAHENAHQYWGVMLFPTDPTYWLVEGLAFFAQYDYTAAVHYGATDRDAYLASRYRWNALCMRYYTDPKTIPALVPKSWNDAPTDVWEYTTWAYLKSSATLDHLRVVLGEETFAEGLRSYTKSCLLEPCSTTDFRTAMETASGTDLGTFLDQWVYATNYPRVTIGFTTSDTSVTVEATQDPPLETPLELWVVLEDGHVERHQVTLEGSSSTFELDTSAPVRAVKPNPRHDAIVWSRPAQAGDVDFDAEVDGRDLTKCARLLGTRAVPVKPQVSIWDVDVAFDPACDLVEDGMIDDADLAPLLDHFATVRP